jgi:hypothetical protein
VTLTCGPLLFSSSCRGQGRSLTDRSVRRRRRPAPIGTRAAPPAPARSAPSIATTTFHSLPRRRPRRGTSRSPRRRPTRGPSPRPASSLASASPARPTPPTPSAAAGPPPTNPPRTLLLPRKAPPPLQRTATVATTGRRPPPRWRRRNGGPPPRRSSTEARTRRTATKRSSTSSGARPPRGASGSRRCTRSRGTRGGLGADTGAGEAGSVPDKATRNFRGGPVKLESASGLIVHMRDCVLGVHFFFASNWIE